MHERRIIETIQDIGSLSASEISYHVGISRTRVIEILNHIGNWDFIEDGKKARGSGYVEKVRIPRDSRVGRPAIEFQLLSDRNRR